MVRIKSPQDLGAAIVFILIGAAGLYFGKDLRYGTAARMGAGYFPFWLSACIIGFGVIIGLRALVLKGPEIEAPQFRPMLFVVVSTVAFGYLIEYVGLAISTLVLVGIAAYAQRQVNIKETVLLAVGMVAFVIIVFVWALKQPLPVWWGL
jgi:hypothetical protein